MSPSPSQIAASLQDVHSPRTLFGREHELATLRQYIDAHRPIFISGPAGIGKTAMLLTVYRHSRLKGEPPTIFYCAESDTRRKITTHVLVNLFLNSRHLDSLYIQQRKRIASLAELRHFVSQERLPNLTRMMHQNLARGSTTLMLDHLDCPHPKVASLIELWIEHFPVIIVARDPERVGRARWLLSAFEHLALAPLPSSALVRLAHSHLENNHGCDATKPHLGEAVARCDGNPGRLLELLRIAGEPRYQRNGTIQWRLVDLDLRIRAIGRGGPDGRKSRGI